MPKLEQFEIKKYWQVFSGLKPIENKVNHDQVLPVLYNSKLDSSVLNKIWFLADIDDDDNLDFEEFVICMRLIFDMVNKNISSVPDELPDWLVPGSKVSLIKERKKREQIENADLPPKKEIKVDWYMSPEDLNQYEKIYSSCAKLTDGTLTFNELSTKLSTKFFNISKTDLNKVWSLINPQNLPSIDRDPTFYFIHCLRQRNDLGADIPTTLPNSLAEVCNKKQVSYDLGSSNPGTKRKEIVRKTDNLHDNVPSSNTESNSKNVSTNDNDIKEKYAYLTDDQVANMREQLEGLLNYKKNEKTQRKSNLYKSINISSITDDLDNIEQQVEVLENYLNNKKHELQSLQAEIN
ncbi:end3p [Saccharomyces arboricola H-6]|uniref:Actin cytoskeleton-regulatory complex protein END3 n=1 Tax=Saccharomyces arboricola (strain H-6 / AS 2.3317 / CBS 10644) TaxID=1160507 RepID=J8LIP4_SACAR|nr:end3p [Saccharomyces arboricola H-6]